MANDMIRIEVAYAKPERQLILALEVEPGITAKEAVMRSGILDEFPEIDIETAKLGIFGKAAPASTVLNPMDRVEIYRPLIADPREVRKKRAAAGKVMKKGAAGLSGPES